MQLMTSTTSSANVPGAGKSSAAKAPINKKQILMLSWAAGAIAAAVAAWFVWQKLKPQTPRLNDPITKIAAFVTSPKFEGVDFLMQVQFMDVLDKRNEKDKKELDNAFKDGRISETEYRGALQLAWFGKHIARVDKYFAQSGVQRQVYLNELINKKLKEEADLRSGKIKPKDAEEISGNPSAVEEKARIDKWPAEAKDRWYQFQKAYKERKKLI